MTPSWTLGFDLALGMAYFRSLRWTAERFATGDGVKLAAGVVVLRFVLLGGVLALVSRQGALPLLLAALGVFIARAIVLRQAQAA